MSMTRKDYVMLAEVINDRMDNIEHLDTFDWDSKEITAARDAVADLANFLATELWRNNKAFDRDRFLTACGVK